MANFNTHITVAAACTGLLSTLCLKSGYVTVPSALMMTVAGTLGGILPDIDLKYSYPSKIMFSLIGTLAALLWMFSSSQSFAMLEIWIIGLCIFLILRYPSWLVFHRLAVHRGSIHSLSAAMLAAFLTSAVCFQVLGKTAYLSWVLAIAMFFGFVVHLVLDEIYSVDFMNVRIKRSFGSALKLVDTKHITGTCLILLLSMIVWFYTPPAAEFSETVTELHQTPNQSSFSWLPDWLIEWWSKKGQ